MVFAYDAPFEVDFYFGATVISTRKLKVLPAVGDTVRLFDNKGKGAEYQVRGRLFQYGRDGTSDAAVDIYLGKK